MPLSFRPIYKAVLWGGGRIARYKGIAPLPDPIGESWEISGLEGHETPVAGGAFEGTPLSQLLRDHGVTVMGRRLYERYGDHFPLLVKFIDAAHDLSIQVHPDDRMAGELHGCSGKTELWYTLDPLPGAELYTGFTERIDQQQLLSHIAENTLCDVLAKFAPRRGDIFYLPAGRIHSIGAGNFLLEIQQTSDITYRVYDFNRTDLDGKKRELHTDYAVQAMDYEVHGEYSYRVDPVRNKEVVINRCPYFVATLVQADRAVDIPVAAMDSFRIVVVTSGSVTLLTDGAHPTRAKQGDTLLVPAAARMLSIVPDEGSFAEVVTAYVP